MTGTTEPIRVLHVDDDPDFVELAATFLERQDARFSVRTATSAAEGQDLLADHDVDCIVSDYDMPGRTGVAFLEAVREEYPDLPFVLFTGKGSEDVASDAISAGVSDYLRKGSGTERYSLLANRIKNLVARYRAETRLESRAEQQERVAELGQAALAGTAPDSLFERAVTMIAETLDNEYAKVLEYRPDDEELFLRAGTGWQGGLVGEATVGVGEDSQAGHTLRSEAPVVVEDLRTEDRFRGPPLLVDHGVVSGISVIIGSLEDPWGVLGTHTTERTSFTDDDVNFVRNVANVLANAIERAEREHELRRRERRYQAVFNDPNILVGLIGTDGTVLDVNRTAMGYVDAARDEIVGTPFWETPWFDHSETVQAAVRDWIDRASGGEYVEFESELVRPDGEPYTVEGVFRPVTDDGDVVSLLISDRDVTERKRRERDLKETNALLSTLIEALPVGVLAEDESRTVLVTNDRLFELFEMSGSPAEVTGTDCERLAREVSGLFADPDRFVERIDELVAERESVDGERLALADGRTFERSHRSIELPDGEGHLWLYRDVSDRTERERERDATIEFLQSLYDIATDPTLDAEEKITRLLRIGPETLGLPYGHLTRIEVSDEDRNRGTQRVIEASGNHELLQPGDACPLERSYCRKTIASDGLLEIPDALAAGWEGDLAYETFGLGCYIGTTITVDDELYGTVFFASKTPRERPFTDAERTFVRLTSQLVSYELEHDRARRELEQQNERLEEFASIISHDLRNPLNIAEGQLEFAREECDSERLDAVSRAHERMSTLIDDLLTLAREGETVGSVESVDLRTCVERCWQTVDTADATLDPRTERTVRADPSRLQQLLENLYRNSVEHGSTSPRSQAPDDGVEHGSTSSRPEADDGMAHGHPEVTITVGDLPDGFYVADDGPGIPESERDDVFTPGYSTDEGGTGFGLSIVEQIADAHGWAVDVAESETGGARFEIRGVEFADG